MNFKEKLNKYMVEETLCFVNGMPLSKGGLIVSIAEDFIDFKIDFQVGQETKTEIVSIPFDKIHSLSEGQKKQQKTL